MYNPKISIVLPSINPSKWENLYHQIRKSVGKYKFEVIACGPFFPKQEDNVSNLENFGNFRFIRDFGSPSRCLQIAASIAEGYRSEFVQFQLVCGRLRWECDHTEE